MVRGSYRFQFELDRLESRFFKGLLQAQNRVEIVAVGLRADESHRASDHRRTDRPAKLPLRVFPKISENSGNEFLNRVETSKHFRAGEIAARQVRLQRLDQPPLVLSQ